MRHYLEAIGPGCPRSSIKNIVSTLVVHCDTLGKEASRTKRPQDLSRLEMLQLPIASMLSVLSKRRRDKTFMVLSMRYVELPICSHYESNHLILLYMRVPSIWDACRAVQRERPRGSGEDISASHRLQRSSPDGVSARWAAVSE